MKSDEPDDRDIGGVVVASRRADRVSLAGLSANAHLPLVPEGLCHGVRLGAARTICGLPIEAMSVFPGLPFAGSTFLVRCDDCCALLAARR